MPIPTSDLQQPNPSNIIELFELELIQAIHGVSLTYRWHNGVNEDMANIVFGGLEYLRMPIAADGFGYDGKKLPRPTLTISNILGTITTLLIALPQGLEGAKVTRIRTLERYIDHVNFAHDFIATEVSIQELILAEDGTYIKQESSVNPHATPDSSQRFPLEIFYVDRKKSESREAVIFELVAVFDLQGVKVPKRQVLSGDFPAIGTFYA